MKNQGFQNDVEVLDMTAEWLRASATRIAVERELRDSVQASRDGDDNYRGQPMDKLRCRIELLREVEEKAHTEIAARLDAHRVSDQPTLGIDCISEASHLNGDERFILTAATIACLGNFLAEATFGHLFTAYSGLQVSDIVQLLGATVPSEWVRYRKLFLKDAPLMRDGHLVYDRIPLGPEDLMDVTLSVGRETFAVITGTQPENYKHEDE